MVPKYNIMFHLETNLIEIYLLKLLVRQRYIHDNFMILQHSLREMSYTISVCLNYYHHSIKFAFKTSETSTNIILYTYNFKVQNQRTLWLPNGCMSM